MLERSLVIAALVAGSACRSSTPAPQTAPVSAPQATADAPTADAAPAVADPEPPPPARPPIATAPPAPAAGTPAPHVAAALQLLPADADVLVGLNIPRLVTSRFGERFKAMLVGQQDMLPARCAGLAAKDYGDVTLAGGSGPLVAVASGKLRESFVIPCLTAIMKAKGGDLAQKKVAGHKLYAAVGSPEDNGVVAWTKAGVPVMATSEAAITAVLDPTSPKVDADLAALAAHADHTHTAWLAGRVSAAKLAALGVPTQWLSGELRFYGWIEHGTGIQLDAVLVLPSPADALKLETGLRQALEPLRDAADLGPVLSGLQLGAHGNDLHVILTVDATTTAALLAQVTFTPN